MDKLVPIFIFGKIVPNNTLKGTLRFAARPLAWRYAINDAIWSGPGFVTPGQTFHVS